MESGELKDFQLCIDQSYKNKVVVRILADAQGGMPHVKVVSGIARLQSYITDRNNLKPVVEGDMAHDFDGEMRHRKGGEWVRYSDHMNQYQSLNGLLWDAFMVLDHGDCAERLALLEKLESHFKKTGKPG